MGIFFFRRSKEIVNGKSFLFDNISSVKKRYKNADEIQIKICKSRKWRTGE